MEIRIALPSLKTALIAACLFVILALGTAWVVFQPSRQLQSAFDRAITALENRNWKTINELMADDYDDAWGQTRTQAVLNGTEIFRHFFALTVIPSDVVITLDGSTASIRAVIRVEGTGSPIAQAVVNETDALKEPFTIEWRKSNWKPWSWQITRISQPELQDRAVRMF